MTTAINVATLKSEQFAKAYNKVKVNDSNILNEFDSKVATSTTINLLKTGRSVSVLEPQSVGNPNAPKYKDEDMKPVNLARFPYETTITQEELGKLAISDGKLSPVKLAEKTTEHMIDHKDNRTETLIHMAYGAIKGKVITGKGTTLVDFYNLFGLTRHEVTLELHSATEDVPKKLIGLYKHLKAAAKESGTRTQGIKVRIDGDSIRMILGHPKVLENGGEAAKSRLMGFENNPEAPINAYGLTLVPDDADQVDSDGAAYPIVQRGLLSRRRYTPPLMGKQKATSDGTVVSMDGGKHDEFMNILTFSHDLCISHDPTLLAGLKIVKVAPSA